MCGIAGQFLLQAPGGVTRDTIERMLAPIAHRGPDGRGIHLEGPVGLGHCRLAIIDPEGGVQPMANEDETIWIVFNGEIYNFAALRADLLARGHQFRSRSDTEVILHLYEEYGTDCVKRLDGMFAFALWDGRRRRLLLVRDRVGIKPLYYAEAGGALDFASELKSILTHDAVPRDLDPAALHQFLAFHYVPGERTLFRSIRKLPPGHFLLAESGRVSVRQYWDLQFTTVRHDRTFDEAAAELHGLLGQTVRRHMIADVPVGVLLSGGMDSSAVLSLATTAAEQKLHTFTVGFAGEGVVDERPYARLAARCFGSIHHELTIGPDDFWNFLPAYAWHMEEPVCEPPAVALHYVTQHARRHVKVLLSGEGGDEAFGGYPNYLHHLRLERWKRRLGPLRRPVGAAVSLAGRWLGSERARRYGPAFGRPLADHYFSRSSSPGSYFNQANEAILGAGWPDDATGGTPAGYMAGVLRPARHWGPLEQMLYADTKTWLPDDLLVKADKMTMANSVELRVPLLDHHVLEFAASLPARYKVEGGEGKRVLKAAFARLLPAEILTRKKAGFPVPYAAWLRGPLAGRVRDVLLSAEATGRGYFQPRAVERLLASDARDGGHSREIFCLLALEFWHRAFVHSGLPTRTSRLPEPALTIAAA
jgi:asparagine synthase (glutamine-hydrolysing)